MVGTNTSAAHEAVQAELHTLLAGVVCSLDKPERSDLLHTGSAFLGHPLWNLPHSHINTQANLLTNLSFLVLGR